MNPSPGREQALLLAASPLSTQPSADPEYEELSGIQLRRALRQGSSSLPVSYQQAELRHEQHSPPVRDIASLKGVRYGPGHEKYPSWPTSAAGEVPAVARAPPTGGSQRSKSWTDHTHYPKETLEPYTRPYMKRNTHPHSQQLRPVFEAIDQIDTRTRMPDDGQRSHSKQFSRNSRSTPPERDVTIDDYVQSSKKFQPQDLEMDYSKDRTPKKLTQAELEEYTRGYEETLTVQHQKQSSYAQSEGYHSYVSSTDSTSTPFLDRLRREVDSSLSSGNGTWERPRGDRDSVVTTSSGSASSSETLKWHGSMSDVSVASSSYSSTSKQQIAHSAKVKTPQRHGSEAVLYIESPGSKASADIEHREPPNCQQHLKLFPISTYSVPESTRLSNRSHNSYCPPKITVAERVSEFERHTKYISYNDSKKSSKAGDPVLKAKQKKALLSFYERQQQKEINKQSWRSEPQLASEIPQPAPPIRPPTTSRRASSASDYADWKELDFHRASKNPLDTSPTLDKPITQFHVPNNSRFSPNSVLDGPVIVGQEISLDEWVPERPPKNSKLLRNVFPDLYKDRNPSPELPLPSPPTVLEDEVFNNDEPFPPPPEEVYTQWRSEQDATQWLRPENHTQGRPSEELPKPIPVYCSPSSQAITNNPGYLRSCSDRNIPMVRPSDLNLKTYMLQSSENTYKKSFKEGKMLRSSFRMPNDLINQNVAHTNIRASMRHYKSNAMPKIASPQKPTISAQKILFRSTTIDESVTSPKRPINPFQRSTSLNQGDEYQAVKTSVSPLSKINLQDQNVSGPIVATKEYRKNGIECSSTVETMNNYHVPEETRNINTPNSSATDSSTDALQAPNNCPPPLLPKNNSVIAPRKALPELRPVAVKSRSQETVCYAPARANIPETPVGSYKLIQNKDEVPAPPVPNRPVLPPYPDLITHAERSAFKPPFESPQLNSKSNDKCKRDMQPTFAIEFQKPIIKSPEKCMPVLSEIENKEEEQICDNKDIPQEIGLEPMDPTQNGLEKVDSRVENVKETDVTDTEVSSEVSSDPVCEVESIVDVKLLSLKTSWEPLPAEVAWNRTRLRLLSNLPPGHHLTHHSSLREDGKCPSDFIKDLFGEESADAGSLPNPPDAGESDDSPAPSSETDISTLTSELLLSSERLVSELSSALAACAKDTDENEALGTEIQGRLGPAMAAKFASHHYDVGNIAALTAALAARLARAHDDIANIGDDIKMGSLRAKQEKLIEQLNEARALKSDIDSRAATLAASLSTALGPEMMQTYRTFINNKPKHIIRARFLQHKLDNERQRLRLIQQLHLNDN